MNFVGIDLEHSTISQEEASRIISACHGSGTLCLPRLASHNMEMAKRLLDSGADGLIVPTVSTSEEAERLIAWSKYPPKGRRGYGIASAQGYGFDFSEYVSKWNDISSLIVQIETIEGVENIEEILSHEEIDGVMVGPYDLSGSLGIPGEIHHRLVQAACRRVIVACAKFKRACGTQLIEPDRKTVHAAFSAGYTFLVLSSDIFLLWKWSERMKALIRVSKK